MAFGNVCSGKGGTNTGMLLGTAVIQSCIINTKNHTGCKGPQALGKGHSRDGKRHSGVQS